MADKSIGDATKQDAPLCIAEWLAPFGYSFPEKLRVDRFAGLVSAGIIRYPANVVRRAKIVTYWISSSAHDAVGDDFRSAAGFTAKARASLTIHVGIQGDVLQRRRPFFKGLATPGFWIGLIGAIVGLLGVVTGFIGNAEKLDQGWIQATTSPSCIVTVPNEKVQLLENKEEVLEEIPWYNETELETNVDIFSCKLEPLVQNVKLRPVPRSFNFSKYEHKNSSLAISASEPGSYMLTLIGRQKGSYLWALPQPLKITLMLEVFPLRTIKKVNMQRTDPRTCELHGELTLGKATPGGLNCSFWLKGAPEVYLESNVMVHLQDPEEYDYLQTIDSPNAKTTDRRTLVEWTTTVGSDAFARRHFVLLLKSSVDKTPEQWRDVGEQNILMKSLK